jgi:hypothetical protein
VLLTGRTLDLAPTPRVFVSHALRDTLPALAADRCAAAFGAAAGERADLIFSPLQLPAPAPRRRASHCVGARPRRQPAAARPAVKRRFAAIAEAGPGIILEDKATARPTIGSHRQGSMVREAAASFAPAEGPPIELLPGKLVMEIKQAGPRRPPSAN